MNPIPAAAPVMNESTFALCLVLLLLAPLGHRRRRAHQHRPWPLAFGRSGHSRQPRRCRRRSHRICSGGRDLHRDLSNGAGPYLSSRRQALELAGRGAMAAEPDSASPTPQTQLALLFEFQAVALAALIPWGSGADRLRLTAGAAIAAVLAAIAFPLVTHWVWAGGWLAQLPRQLLAWRWLSRSRWRGHSSCTRRAKRAGRHLDRRLPQRQISQGRLLHGHAGPQRRLRSLRRSARTGRMARLQRCAARCSGSTRLLPRFQSPPSILCCRPRRPSWPPSSLHKSASANPTPACAPTDGSPAWLPPAPAPRSSLPSTRSSSVSLPASLRRFSSKSWSWPSPSMIPPAQSPFTRSAAFGVFSPLACSQARPGQFIAQLVGVATLLGLVLPLVYLLFFLLNRVVAFRVDRTASASAWTCTSLAAEHTRSLSFIATIRTDNRYLRLCNPGWCPESRSSHR